VIVIRRKAGESIWVGGAEVRVLSLSPSRVKLGVEAPRELPVLRSEMKAAGDQNQLAAQGRLPGDVADWLGQFQPQRPA
jgi:carbon storage regulator